MGRITGGIKFFEANLATKKSLDSLTLNDFDGTTFDIDVLGAMIDGDRTTAIDGSALRTGALDAAFVDFRFKSPVNVESIFILGTNATQVSPQFISGGSFVTPTNYITQSQESSSRLLFDTSSDLLFLSVEPTLMVDAVLLYFYGTPTTQPLVIHDIYITREIGTFEGYPELSIRRRLNRSKLRTIGGKLLIKNTRESKEFSLRFVNYGVNKDIELANSLFNRDVPFLIYPSGGRSGDQYFKVQEEAWQMDQIFKVSSARTYNNRFSGNGYLNGVDTRMTMEETR